MTWLIKLHSDTVSIQPHSMTSSEFLRMSIDDGPFRCRPSLFAHVLAFQCLLFFFQLLVLSKNSPDGVRIQLLWICSSWSCLLWGFLGLVSFHSRVLLCLCIV